MDNTYNRQLGLIHPDKLQIPIAIIGAGSIGGWTALALGKLGARNITVFDGDTVEEQNAGSQMFKSSDVGLQKVHALQSRLNFLIETPIEYVATHWDNTMDLTPFKIVIAAVDSITVRKQLFEHITGKDIFYVDGRMAGNTFEIYTTHGTDLLALQRYSETLFEEGQQRDVPCSERSVVYNVFAMGGFMANTIKKFVNGEQLPKEQILDLYNLFLFT